MQRSFSAQSMAIESALRRNRHPECGEVRAASAAEGTPAEPLPASPCRACGGQHTIQRCPAIRAAMLAASGAPTAPGIFDTLIARAESIAELRATGHHAAATSLREDTLNEIEAWLDPEIAAIRAAQLTADRERVARLSQRTRELLEERVEGCPF